MKFDSDRAELIVLKFYKAYSERTHLFKYLKVNNGDAPQNKTIPSGVLKGSSDHILFLFFANLMTYSNSSDQGFLQAKSIWENHRWTFESSIGKHYDISDMKEVISESGFVYPNALAVNWMKVSKTLYSKYNGDPLAIFKDMKSISQIMKLRKKDFPGLGPKLFSLLALFYEELGLLQPIEGAFPVDIHIQAQCMGTKIIGGFTKDIINSQRMAEFIRPKLYKACKINVISTLAISHAMWFTGNKLCQYCKRKRATMQVLCPVIDKCSGRVSTKLYRSTGKWNVREEEHGGLL